MSSVSHMLKLKKNQQGAYWPSFATITHIHDARGALMLL